MTDVRSVVWGRVACTAPIRCDKRGASTPEPNHGVVVGVEGGGHGQSVVPRSSDQGGRERR